MFTAEEFQLLTQFLLFLMRKNSFLFDRQINNQRKITTKIYNGNICSPNESQDRPQHETAGIKNEQKSLEFHNYFTIKW